MEEDSRNIEAKAANAASGTAINKKIFKAYDIRGIVPDELNPVAAYFIGQALCHVVGFKRIVIARDHRESSPQLYNAVIRAIADFAEQNKKPVEIISIGLASTPQSYFANWHFSADASVMITASHNPKQWNGMKICLKNAVPVGIDSGLKEIRDKAVELAAKGIPEELLQMLNSSKINSSNNEASQENSNFRQGSFFNIREENIVESYKSFIKSSVSGSVASKPMKIVVDFANAMGIKEFEALSWLESSRFNFIRLYDSLDSSFPNHEANPLKAETLNDLQKAVVENNADIGIAFDGDADRIGFVDSLGRVFPMDFIIAVIADDILEKSPGSKILYDLRSSNAVKEEIEKKGGIAEMCRVGHAYIKRQMRQAGAVFAGELSGHYYFRENSYAETTALAFLKVIDFLQKSSLSLSAVRDRLSKYFHSGEINIRLSSRDKIGNVFDKLKKRFPDGKLTEIDGLRIDCDGFWLSVRPSNTEPVLRLNIESVSKEKTESLKKELVSLIKATD